VILVSVVIFIRKLEFRKIESACKTVSNIGRLGVLDFTSWAFFFFFREESFGGYRQSKGAV